MARVLYFLCSSLIVATLYHHVNAQQPSRRPKERPPFAGFGFRPPAASGSGIRLKGLCPDGWEEGTSHDIYENEIPICIKINENLQTWADAKESCRQDFGFLLKVDSAVSVDGNDLMSLVLSKGITSVWTGAHTENNHLIWDDLTPHQIKPNNRNQSILRPWVWSSRNPKKISAYCGKLDIYRDADDEKKKRKKRQTEETSESDSSDQLFKNTDSIFGLNQYPTSFDTMRSSDSFPQTSAFQEMLTRTQLNDQLAALPTASLGVQSAHQLPGTGLSGNNLQAGGLATISPLYSQTTINSETDSEKDLLTSEAQDLLKNAANLAFHVNNDGHNINTKASDNIQLPNNPNPNHVYNQQIDPAAATDLVSSVREQAVKLSLGDRIPAPTPTEMLETLNDQLAEQGMTLNTDISDQQSNDMMGLLNSDLLDLIPKTNIEESDSKSHAVLGLHNTNVPNVLPTEQSKVISSFKPEGSSGTFDNHFSELNLNEVSPITVSPIIDSVVGQDIQNQDDVTVLSETLSELLHDITNTDSLHKDSSEPTADISKPLQSDMPKKSETAELLSDEAKNSNNVMITTQATNVFNVNSQVTDSIASFGTESFPNTEHESNLQNVINTLADANKVSLSSDDTVNGHEDSVKGSTNLFSSEEIVPASLTEKDNSNTKEHGTEEIINSKANADLPTSEMASKLDDTLYLDLLELNDSINKASLLKPEQSKSNDNIDILNNKTVSLNSGSDDPDKDDDINSPPVFDMDTEDSSIEANTNKNNNDPTNRQLNEEDASKSIESPSNDDSKHTVLVNENTAKENTKDGDDVGLQKDITDTLRDYLSFMESNKETNGDQEKELSRDGEGSKRIVGVSEPENDDKHPELANEKFIDQENKTLALEPDFDTINADIEEEKKLDSELSDTTGIIKAIKANVVEEEIPPDLPDASDESKDKTLEEQIDNKIDDAIAGMEFNEKGGSPTEDTEENFDISDQQTNRNQFENTVDQTGRLPEEMEETDLLNSNDDASTLNTDALEHNDIEGEDVDSSSSQFQVLDEDGVLDRADIHETKVHRISDGKDETPEDDNKSISSDDVHLKNDRKDENDIGDLESVEPEKNALDAISEIYRKFVGNNRRGTDMNDGEEIEHLDDETEVSTLSEKAESEDDITPKNNHTVETDELEDNTGSASELNNIPSLAEVLSPDSRKTAILPIVSRQEMELSTCQQKLPSVCFTYQLEVMSKVSTCGNGWYGHILHDKCYKIVTSKQNYWSSRSQCKAIGADIVEGHSEFERTFTLLAVSLDGTLFRGTKFWKRSSSNGLCQYFDETGIKKEENCNRALNVICVKTAMKPDIAVTAEAEDTVEAMFMMSADDVKLTCDLTGTTAELPVMWFKDGILVSTITSDDASEPSLRVNQGLIESVKSRTNRDMSMTGLQGRYWCEVWDTLPDGRRTRQRSRTYDVRFSDVMSFHGSMELNQFTYRDQMLFNLMDRMFPSLTAAEADLKKVFSDVIPVIKGSLDFISGVNTHVDSVRSSPNVLEYHTYITLTRNYSVTDEINVYNRLKGLLRAALGNTVYMSQLPGKTPVTTFRTMALQSTISCPAATLRTNKDNNLKTVLSQVYKFRHTLLGDQADSNETCSETDLRPAGTAKCLGNFYTGAYWGDVRASDCRPIPEDPIDLFNQDIWGKTAQTDTLSEIAKTVVNEKNVGNITGKVAKITRDAVKFTPTDINKIAEVLERTTEIDNVPEEVGRNVIETVDKLMTVSEKEVEVANVETNAANRIIKSLERCAEHVDMSKSDRFRLVTDNIAVEVWLLKENSRPVIGLAAHSDEKTPKTVFKADDIATVFQKSELFDANVDAAIELPEEAFTPKVKGQPAHNKLTMMVFRKSKLFEMADRSTDGRALNMDKNEISRLNSYVISASIAGKKLTGLKEKVRTIFKPLSDNGKNRSSNCVFWDFNLNERKGGWSNVGCVYDGKINGRDICLCDHLTNFAVLLDFHGQEKPIPDHHELSLSIITMIGLSLSILGLSLTIISFVFFKKLRQGRAQQTLFNLAVALLCAMMVFLIGIKQTHHDTLCMIVAVLLHYFILVSFMWMLMEAILQYLTFVKILGTYITRFTLKSVIPAWGLPLIPVITILSVDYNLYKGGSQYCWMSLPAFYYGFAIPISCIIATNIVIFVITIVSIFRRGKGLRSNQKKQKMAMTNLQAAITSFILLGLSWVFGYLAILDARLPFQYIFTILNSLQGFFIFILFVVRKKKVREQWYIICCKGMDREKVSRSLSASNSIPSSYSNGSSSRSSKNAGKDRDRSDSTKTTTSVFSNGSLSNGFTNYGYDKSFDNLCNRRTF